MRKDMTCGSHGLVATSADCMAELLGGNGLTSLSRELRIELLRILLWDVQLLCFESLSSDELDHELRAATGLPPDTRLSTICTTFDDLCKYCQEHNVAIREEHQRLQPFNRFPCT